MDRLTAKVFALSLFLAFVFSPGRAEVPASPVGWAWVGGLTEAEAIVTARLNTTAPARLELLASAPSAPASVVAPVLTTPMNGGMLHRFKVVGLKPDTVYRYRFISATGTALDEETRTLRTFPVPKKPASFCFAVGACAKEINSPVFTAAIKQGARFFLHTGDFHYADIIENRVESFQAAYDTHLSAPRLRTLLEKTPLIYQWDDHDFGSNDSNRTSPSRDAALRNYREMVPHYPLTVGVGTAHNSVDQAFTVGRVRFILSDLRSERDPVGRRMMSAQQDAWLRAELFAARDSGCPLIFWVSSVPWNGAPSKDDRWQGYAKHRTEIADFIKANGLTGRVVILAGDAHMAAIDDGENSDFATGGGAPIRVFQAGPIYNKGSYKGGPYNHGACYQSKGSAKLTQFGLVDIRDDGHQIHVSWSGRQGSDGIGNQVLVAERDAEGPIQLEFNVP